MTIITVIIVAIWWNPYAITQHYYNFAKEKSKQIEREENEKLSKATN